MKCIFQAYALVSFLEEGPLTSCHILQVITMPREPSSPIWDIDSGGKVLLRRLFSLRLIPVVGLEFLGLGGSLWRRKPTAETLAKFAKWQVFFFF